MIKYNYDNSYEYFDKNGTPILEGYKIKYPSGRIMEVYLADTGELGTDATNPIWLEDGRAVPCEWGIYPLEYDETEEVEVVKN